MTPARPALAAPWGWLLTRTRAVAKAYSRDAIGHWQRVASTRKPIVAAVAGYALGGGAELALMADLIVVAPSALFGQPEIKLGVIPGAGGTQRLARIIGRPRTMDMVLNDRKVSGKEAVEWGIATGMCDEGESVVAKAVGVAERLARMPKAALQAGKEAVNAGEWGWWRESRKSEALTACSRRDAAVAGTAV